MNKLLATLGIVALAMLLCAPAALADDDGPTVTITVEGIPADGMLTLGVGETHTFKIHIRSDEPFVFAAAMPDAYYPGRGVFFRGRDQVSQANSADLEMTVTGKSPTADLAEVCDWYGLPCVGTEEGVAPLAIVAGARFKGGVSVGTAFPFTVRVTE